MTVWEKLGLIIVIVTAPMWINNMDGYRGLVFEVILFVCVFLFFVGGHLSPKKDDK